MGTVCVSLNYTGSYSCINYKPKHKWLQTILLYLYSAKSHQQLPRGASKTEYKQFSNFDVSMKTQSAGIPTTKPKTRALSKGVYSIVVILRIISLSLIFLSFNNFLKGFIQYTCLLLQLLKKQEVVSCLSNNSMEFHIKPLIGRVLFEKAVPGLTFW